MPTYTIEMLWKCAHCKSPHANRGLSKHCANCGHPKSDKDAEFFPEDVSEANALTGENARKANAGPDWKCKYCEALQNGLNKCCTECGADKETGAKAWEAVEKTVKESLETGAKTETARGVVITANQDVASTPNQPADARPESPHVSAWSARILSFKRPIAIGMTVVCLALALWLIFRTKIVDVNVSTVHWEHKVLIDRWQVFAREGWIPDGTAFNTWPIGERIHHYDHVRVGSHQEAYDAREPCGETCTSVPRTCSKTPRTCTSNKNGTATCSGGDTVCSGGGQSCSTKYCNVTHHRTVDDFEEQARYAMWYRWSVWDWGYDRTVQHAGDTLVTSWPTDDELKPTKLEDGERERTDRKRLYTVRFAAKADSWSYEPPNETEFQKYTVGSRWKIKVGIAKGVEVLPP